MLNLSSIEDVILPQKIEYNSEHNNRGSICSILENLVQDNKRDLQQKRTQKLIYLLNSKSRKIQSFRPNEFNKDGKILLSGEHVVNNENNDAIKISIHSLNFINFLQNILEVVRRLYRNKKGDVFSYAAKANNNNKLLTAYKKMYIDILPIAILQNFVMHMLSRDINPIQLSKVYGANNLYGLIVGKKLTECTIEKLVAKDLAINRNFYSVYNTSRNITIVGGRNFLKDQLLGTYGGESESDDEDYSSDDEDCSSSDEGCSTNKYGN
ncbi:MAG: hypothetical protein COB50_01865 [Thiotrichales bacterium]|nr:MAG: hypothetical protein COB50_01865 [Thiotrichales bacterium]